MSDANNSAGNGIAKNAIRERLEDLRHEFKEGEAKMKELEKQQAYVRDTMLRISGAIQALEELLVQTPASPTADGDNVGSALMPASEA